MNNVDENALSQVLIIVLGVLVFCLIILSAVLAILKMKDIKNKKENKKSKTISKENNIEKTASNKFEYNKQSIFDFMEFDKIEDNMIVQKNGKRFLMVVECQGVNYDLMSRMEKIGVEEGFQQFLNTLRHPIQIYIQTRTVNLDESISKYKAKVKEVEDKYNKMLFRYNTLKNSDEYIKNELEIYLF